MVSEYFSAIIVGRIKRQWLIREIILLLTKQAILFIHFYTVSS